MTVKRVFWRFWIGNAAWSAPRRFGWVACPGALGGMLYVGVVVFGRALLYSDAWY